MRSDAALDAAAATARLRRAPAAATSRPFGPAAAGPTATRRAAAALFAVTTLPRAARASSRGALRSTATNARVLPPVAATATTLSVSTLTTPSPAHLFQALADPSTQLSAPCASAHLLEALT